MESGAAVKLQVLSLKTIYKNILKLELETAIFVLLVYPFTKVFPEACVSIAVVAVSLFSTGCFTKGGNADVLKN